ncbi:respiratory nitrate reductase subunit gamma [Chloroflexota bacterium]
MESVTWLQVITYAFIALIIIVFLARLYRYARMPAHLRWELYPLAGEKNRPLGGSYLEDREWWSSPREEKSFIGEMKFMGEEVISFKEYYRLNRSYWYYVFPFHIGAFAFLTLIAVLIIGALTQIGSIEISAASPNLWGKFLHFATPVVGGIALVFGTLGGVALLLRRIFNTDLRPYTRRLEFFNLVLILALFLTGLISWALYDGVFAIERQYFISLLTFSGIPGISALTTVHILLVLVTAVYLPFTNMMHFFAKWFTYHKIRWDDAPNLRGSNLENKLGPLHNLPLSWAAPHIQELGRWSDIARIKPVEKPTPRVKKGDTE